MKNLQITIILLLSLSFSSFALQQRGDKHSDKDQMEVDAYAKANIECEYSLTKLQYDQDRNNKLLKLKVSELKSDVTTFRQKMFNRYNDIGNLKIDFNKMVEASYSSLTVCKKLDALKKSLAEERAARIKAQEKK